MPNYEISCHKDDGTILLKYAVQCSGDMHARIVASALRTKDCGQIEVWRGEKLIYEEPRPKLH